MRGLAVGVRGSAYTCLAPGGRSTACLRAARRHGTPCNNPYILP